MMKAHSVFCLTVLSKSGVKKLSLRSVPDDDRLRKILAGIREKKSLFMPVVCRPTTRSRQCPRMQVICMYLCEITGIQGSPQS